jgi:hypothetical protein
MLEVLKQALDALENVTKDYVKNRQYKHNKAIEALRQVIAELESQEPVAWMSEDEHTVYTSKQVDGYFQHDHTPLYTHPPQRTWVGLTTDEIAVIHANYPNPQGFALALQAKLKEKNND